MENEIYNPEDELTHWGIPGMKWGQRRYQNKDGTLTPAGKKRYNAELAKVRQEEAVVKNRQAVKARMDRLEARKKAVADKTKALDDAEGIKSKASKLKKTDTDPKPEKKSYKDMTDDELKAAIARSQLENQYRQYNPEPAPKESFGKRFLNDAAKPALINAGKDAIEKMLKKTVDNALKDKTAAKVDYDELTKKAKYEYQKLINEKQEYELAPKRKAAKEAAEAAKAAEKAAKKEARSEKVSEITSHFRNTTVSNVPPATVDKGKTTVDNIIGRYDRDAISRLDDD